VVRSIYKERNYDLPVCRIILWCATSVLASCAPPNLKDEPIIIIIVIAWLHMVAERRLQIGGVRNPCVSSVVIGSTGVMGLTTTSSGLARELWVLECGVLVCEINWRFSHGGGGRQRKGVQR
jgi:hypothetical protein